MIRVTLRLFVISMEQRQIKMFSDGHKLVRFNLYEITIMCLKNFMRKNILKTDTMIEGDLIKGYNHPTYRILK